MAAEIGCNHMGDIRIEKELILLAKKAGAGYVKFQKRNNQEFLTKDLYSAPSPVPENSYEDAYDIEDGSRLQCMAGYKL